MSTTFNSYIYQLVAEGDLIKAHIHRAAKRQGEYEIIITEPEATKCFSINFQLNFIILSLKFSVYLHFTLFTLWRKHELRKQQSQFCKIQTRHKFKNFTLKVLSHVLFMIFVLFVFCCML